MFYPRIPQELLFGDSSEGDVSILIGENGSGKSQLLGQLTTEYLRQGKKVFAISNSIYDKFPEKNSRHLFLLRDRGGRAKAKKSIKNALLNITEENDLIKLKNASRVLQFIGYEPRIGIERVLFTMDTFENALTLINDYGNILSKDEVEELKLLLYKSYFNSSEQIIWLYLDNHTFSEINSASLVYLLKWETALKKLELIDEFKIYLRKNGQDISLLEASSGELSFISSVVYLATAIEDNTAILIDEPENSLHPSWQKDYIKILLELFYLYQPRIVAATHSALIVTGAEVSNSNTKVFECRDFQFFRRMKDPVNIEEAFIDYFNVVTPQNRYLSNLVIDLLNKLTAKELTLNGLNSRIEGLKSDSFDERQIAMLDGVKELALKIIERTNG